MIVNGYTIEPGADLRGADLRGEDLRGADLRDADLRDADLSGANVHIYQGARYVGYYTGGDMLCIGCEYHSITHWLEHYAEIGKKNSYTEQEILENKLFIDMVAAIYSNRT